MTLKNKENPVYFETMFCSCGETENLKKHKFTDEVLCAECVERINKLLRDAEDANDQ